MPCPYNVILGRDTALPSPLSCPRVQLELFCVAETGLSKKSGSAYRRTAITEDEKSKLNAQHPVLKVIQLSS